MISLLESLRRQTDLSLGAPEVKINDCLNAILKELSLGLMNWTILSLGASELEMDYFLCRILKELYQFEPGSSRGQDE